MKIVFFGTPDYVLPIIKAIHKKFVTGPGKSPIVAVVTASPKPVGRKKILSYSAIDKWAHEHKLPIFYTANDLLKANLDFELGILASYGEIIKKEVINLFPQGILVIHPSLLPKYRGASPVPEAIKNGDTVTGVTILKMDEKMDHGPIITQFKENILHTDTSAVLRDRLFEKSAEVLVETLTPFVQGKIKLKKQNDDEATFTKLVTKQDGFIELTGCDLVNAERFIRAMQPWPGAWTLLPNGKRLKLLRAHLENFSDNSQKVRDFSEKPKLVLDEVQLEGKDPVSYKQFKEAYPSIKLSD
jgi:methionyl-tRNA formyltransferase